MEPIESGWHLTIRGVVQGVGFRPFVATLARQHHLVGTVRNGPEGVEIDLNATEEARDGFLAALRAQLPPMASIESITLHPIPPVSVDAFTIVPSEKAGAFHAQIPPDMGVCPACEAELYDPDDRRYRYPFITCTHCGVRYSIIETLPYDRPNTSMRFFPMCDACAAEYHNPTNRRYHAQPIGCHDCGPRLWLDTRNNTIRHEKDAAILEAAKLLSAGKILAVKGVGGYHLMCDATHPEALKTLRRRKERPAKPFAIMVRSLDDARTLAHLSPDEATLLNQSRRPIVLLRKRRPFPLPDLVAPELERIGIFLPYTALHLLLLDAVDRPLVATSANRSGEPLCTTREELECLLDVYDGVLDHDRPIVRRVDDSVVMLADDQPIVLRRARGYAPTPIPLPHSITSPALALGAHQKSTIALAWDRRAILSPHIGDLDTLAAETGYRETIQSMEQLYRIAPQHLIHDRHPRYTSTHYAHQRHNEHPDLTLHTMGHHHAHIVAVMIEKGITDEVFGVAFDGSGAGEDGTVWGGEFLITQYRTATRMGHLKPFALLGGEQAIRQPRRIALALLFDRYGVEALHLDAPTIRAFTPAEQEGLYRMWERQIGTLKTSSMGRLFDGVASLLGVVQTLSYEGESGMKMEGLYDPTATTGYPLQITDGIIDPAPWIDGIVQDAHRPSVAYTRFLHTLIDTIEHLYTPWRHLPLVCSGGVFQNPTLVTLLRQRFPDVHLPTAIPPNDGAIALGQLGRVL